MESLSLLQRQTKMGDGGGKGQLNLEPLPLSRAEERVRSWCRTGVVTGVRAWNAQSIGLEGGNSP